MSFPELLLVAVGLSMDAFAISVCAGLSMPKATVKKALIVGLYFGVFQAGMPIIGYVLAKRFAGRILEFDHWVVFILLGLIGGKMFADGLKKTGCPDRDCPAEKCSDRECPGGEPPQIKEMTLRVTHMLPLAFATSIDALAVGVSFAFLNVYIAPAVLSIGVITFLLSVAGVKIGNIFGVKFKSKAELSGGVILILLGFKILIEHLGA